MTDCQNRIPPPPGKEGLPPRCREFGGGLPCGRFIHSFMKCFFTDITIFASVPEKQINGFTTSERSEFRAAVEQMLD